LTVQARVEVQYFVFVTLSVSVPPNTNLLTPQPLPVSSELGDLASS